MATIRRKGQKGRALVQAIEGAQVVAAGDAADDRQHCEGQQGHHQISREVKDDNLGRLQAESAGSAAGQGEHQKTGVGNGGIGEEALEIGLRNGGEVSDEQGGAGDRQQDRR